MIGGLILNSGFPWSLTAVLAGGASGRAALVRGGLHDERFLAHRFCQPDFFGRKFAAHQRVNAQRTDDLAANRNRYDE